MIRVGLVCAFLSILLSTGCSDGSGNAQSDGGVDTTTATDTGGSDGTAADAAPLVTLSGSVALFGNDDDTPLAGATLSPLGDPANSITSDSNGLFSLQVPVGPGFVLLQKDSLLSSIYGGDVTADGLSGAEFGLVPPSLIDSLGDDISSFPTRDTAKGHLVVEFDLEARGDSPLGTEKVSISPAAAASIVFDASDKAKLSDTLVTDGGDSLVFFNVPVGQVTVTLSAPGCTPLMAGTATYPVQANTITFVQVVCQ